MIILFDPDAAGIKAALRGALILISKGFFVKVASLPDGLDPDEYIIKYGKEAFEKIIDQAQDLIAFHTQLQLSRYPQPLTAQDKVHVITELAETIAQHPDEIVRREWAKYVAEQMDVAEELVVARLKKPVRASSPARKEETAAPAVSNETEEKLLAWLLQAPQYVTLCRELTAADFSSPLHWNLLEALRQAADERLEGNLLLEKTISLVPDGKNLIAKLALLQPPEDFQPDQDIEACAAKLTQNSVQKRLKKVQLQMKQLGAGNVPQEMIKEYMLLQSKLKK